MGDFGATGNFGERIEQAGFVNDAREFFNDSVAVEFFGVGNADEGKVCAAEEFFHIFEVTTRG